MTKALKNKLQKDNINIGKNELLLVENFFYYDDVKSALQGLMEEIRLTDLEWVVYSDGSQKRMSEKERKELIIEFIKKWFPDVVKDD